ncbi:hypothetical protein LTR49_024031 [Elasticomyces elasticus]|nr:hypothetical protein LTR49_024031 [Elasticomyces elasticus]
MASSVLDNIKRTTQQTIDGFRKWDIDAIMAPRADNCTYQALPKSLGLPPLNNKEYREWYTAEIIPLMQNFDVEVHTTLHDAEARKSMIHGFSTATSPVGPYRMELCLMMSFNEAGDKVVKMEEMFDSAYHGDLMSKLQEMAGQAK